MGTPWQPTYIAVYAAFLGEVGESYTIGAQHWRHDYLIMGMVCGGSWWQAKSSQVVLLHHKNEIIDVFS